MAKVIKAVFGAGQLTKTCPQWQYDYNTVLQFVGLDLPENYEVDLSNSKTGQSTTVLGNADGCTIPAQFFIPGSTIYAWVFIAGNDYGYTRAQVEIPISPRAQHTGDPPTPEQQDALDQAIALLNEAAEDLAEAEHGIPTAIETALQEAKDSGEFDGADGYSPSASISKVGDTATITITDQNGTTTATVTDGTDGTDGEDGVDGNSIWYGGAVRTAGTTPYYFLSDLSGRTDVSPQVGDLIVSNIYWLWQITRINNNIAYLRSIGSLKGTDGTNGTDGYSPSASVSKAGNTATITITDQNGTTTATVTDGTDGQDGAPGQDGFSPEVTITEISGGHRVTITDEDHPSGQSFDVMDGTGGGGATEIAWMTYGTSTSAEVEAAYQAGKLVMVKYDSKVYQLVYRGSATSHVFGTAKTQTESTIYTVSCASDVWTATSKNLIEKPASPTTGDFLCWNGSAWAATTLSAWQGGNYGS